MGKYAGRFPCRTLHRIPFMTSQAEDPDAADAREEDPSVANEGPVVAATRVFMAHQRALTAYIVAMVHDYHVADDVRQEVWLVMARKWDVYGALPDPWPTMRAIARRQSLVAMRRVKSLRHVPSDAALEAVAAAIIDVDREHDERHTALNRCLEELPADWRALLDLRYRDGLAVTAMAVHLKRRADTVSMTLHRVRARLLDCIELRLRRAGES